MTDVVVVDKQNTVVVTTDSAGTVITDASQPQVIYTGIMGPQGIPGTAVPLSNLSDVDSTVLAAGSVLVYNTTNSKWVSTTLLNQQTVDSGQY